MTARYSPNASATPPTRAAARSDAGPGFVVSGAIARPVVVPAAWPSPRSGDGHLVVPRVGLLLPRQLTFEAWLGVGRQLLVVVNSSAWCLGDWLVYGQQAFASRYREAVERTGLDYQTLRNYAWVAKRFELSRRRDALSFGHHAEVAALPGPEQDFWLRKAEQFGWPTSQLRREVRASLQQRKESHAQAEQTDPEQAQPASQLVTIRVSLTPEQAQLCQEAAATHALTVAAWAAHVLSHAARRGQHDSASQGSA
jgi:hypothetical protein